VDARTAVTIRATADEVYERWRDLEQLPTFMYHLERVEDTGAGRSHWVAKGPAGRTVEWFAELTEDEPGRCIAWRSIDGGDVQTSGRVELRPAPGGRGTELHVQLSYAPPGGALGAVVAKLFGEEPGQQIADDVRRFKQLVETGEIARSDGAPLGTRTANIAHQEDGQPPEGATAAMARADAEEVRP
jgi:uncharacterized membrane protein